LGLNVQITLSPEVKASFLVFYEFFHPKPCSSSPGAFGAAPWFWSLPICSGQFGRFNVGSRQFLIKRYVMKQKKTVSGLFLLKGFWL